MSLRPLRVALLLLFGCLFAPASAHAQTTATGVTIALSTQVVPNQPPSLARLDANLQPIQKRALSLNPEGINLQDCRDNQYIAFPLAIMGGGNYIGEVWATDVGANCAEPTQRASGVAQCYKIQSARFIITPVQTVNISVKEMIKGLGDQSATTDSFGCRQTNLSTVNVWFLALSGSTVNGQLDVPIKVSTLGPQALSGVKAQPGNGRITMTWDLVGEGGSVDVIGAVAYCDPDPMPVGASDASVVCTTPEASADADADAAETPEPTCTGGTSTAAGDPIPQAPNIDSNGKACSTAALSSPDGKAFYPDKAFNDKYRCGDVTGAGATASSIVASGAGGVPFVNGKTYAVAVAAADSFGNIGQLSSPICQFPEETSDFWRDYRNGGGQAGGGFCSVESPGVPVGSFSLLVVGVVVGLSTVRRVRRVQRRRNPR